MNLQTFYAQTITEYGCSFNIATGEINPNEGFMVSLPNTELKVSIENFNPEIVRNFINSTASQQNENTFIGSWIDDEFVYLDLSERILDKENAIRTGIRQNQLAIFDNINKVVINLPTPQRSGTMTQQQTYINRKIRELLN